MLKRGSSIQKTPPTKVENFPMTFLDLNQTWERVFKIKHEKKCLQKTVKFGLFSNCQTLYLHWRFEKGFEGVKRIKILKLKENGTSYQGKCSGRQPWAKYLEQSKEVKENWTGGENVDDCFCIIFNFYYKSFISRVKTGY